MEAKVEGKLPKITLGRGKGTKAVVPWIQSVHSP